MSLQYRMRSIDWVRDRDDGTSDSVKVHGKFWPFWGVLLDRGVLVRCARVGCVPCMLDHDLGWELECVPCTRPSTIVLCKVCAYRHRWCVPCTSMCRMWGVRLCPFYVFEMCRVESDEIMNN